MLELAAVGSDPVRALAVAREIGGVAYTSDAPMSDGRPFASLVLASTADPAPLASISDVGSYLVYRRTMRSHPPQWQAERPTPGLVAVFAMVRRSDRTHQQADAHWRDVHAPLALRIHVGMWDYQQCSVVHTFSGPDYDGFALCGFGSEADLRERFFDGPDGQQAIRDDVANFVDGQRSPRRVLCREWHRA